MKSRIRVSAGGHDSIVKLGARLAIVRNERSLTQTEFARSIGVSGAAYHAYERGTRSIPVRSLMLVAQTYDINPKWLLLGTGNQEIDVDRTELEDFTKTLAVYLGERAIKIRPERTAAMISRWSQALGEGRRIPFEDVSIWIDLLRD